MSIAATVHVRDLLAEYPELTIADRCVALTVATYAHPATGYAWPSSHRIAETTGMDAGSVRRCLHRLAAAGLVTLLPRPGRSTLIMLSTAPRTTARGSNPQPDVDPAHSGADPAHPGAGTPRTAARRIGRERSIERRAHIAEHLDAGTGSHRHVSNSDTDCGHRWRTASGDCPVCLDVEATG